MSDKVFCKDCAHHVRYNGIFVDTCFTGPLCPVSGEPTRVISTKKNFRYDCPQFKRKAPKRRWWRDAP